MKDNQIHSVWTRIELEWNLWSVCEMKLKRTVLTIMNYKIYNDLSERSDNLNNVVDNSSDF